MSRTPRRAPYQTARWRLALRGMLCLLLGGCSAKAEYPEPANPGQAIPDPVPFMVSPEEAALYIGHPDVAFIDARPGKQYAAGHLPGAVSFEWTEFRDPEAGLLDGKLDGDLGRLAEHFGSKGVGRERWAIVYGDPLSLWGEEGRIAWTLQYLGAERVSLVDGGWTAWSKAGLPTQKGTVERDAAPFTVEVNDELLARKQDTERFAAQRDDWQTVLVDVREPEEYRGSPGAPLYGALRGGHIPGAVNLPWRSLLQDDGRLKPRDELGELLLSKGIRPDARVITYCTGGVRSAHTWFVLRGLGFPAVKNYAASWWEWSLDRKLAAESGGQRPLPDAPPWPPVDEATPAADEPTPPADEPATPADEPATPE